MEAMDRERNIWVVGGDQRQRALVRLLREDGHTVRLAGLEDQDLGTEPLGPGLAFASQLGYLLLGAFGLPVFAGFSSGLGTLLGPTGGYLLVYPLMAAAVALGRRLWGGRLPSLAASMLIALLLCYAGGTAWFMAATEKSLAVSLSACVFPFVPVDLCKIALASVVGSRLESLIKRAQ